MKNNRRNARRGSERAVISETFSHSFSQLLLHASYLGTELSREVKVNSDNFATELFAECPRRSYSRNNFSNARAAPTRITYLV